MISSAAMCLAIAVFMESRGEPELGQRYVAHVVKNWADDRGVSPCDVILNKLFSKHFEFSVGRSSVKELKIEVKQKIANASEETEAWRRAIEIGRRVNKRKRDITNGAKFFNEKSLGVRYKTPIKARWIGNHVFY